MELVTNLKDNNRLLLSCQNFLLLQGSLVKHIHSQDNNYIPK